MKRLAFLAMSASAALAALVMPRLAWALPNVSGTWACTADGEGANGDQTTRFNLKLSQSGSTVTGSYYKGSASLAGVMSGNTLKGQWKESETSTGVFTFVFDDNGKSFTGTWGIEAGSTGGKWDGVRV